MRSRPPLACGVAPMRLSPVGRQRRDLGPQAARRRTARRAGSCAATPRAGAGARGCSASPDSGTWWARKVPSTCTPSTTAGPGPALGGAQHDHRPAGPLGRAAARPTARPARMAAISSKRGVERVGHGPVDRGRVVARHDVDAVAVALEQRDQLVVGDAGEHGGVGDLVAVEVQDRQHRPVGRRVEELVRVPGGGQRAGLGLAVADHARHHQVGVVEGGAVGVDERVARARRPR